jgi:acetyltransferase-like isoleucine patch superfamily enzyme
MEAGAVVTTDLLSMPICVGVPARAIGYRQESGFPMGVFRSR